MREDEAGSEALAPPAAMNAPAASLLAFPRPEDTGAEAVVAAACAGDRDAFATLYRRYRRFVHGILLARVDRADVEDLVQDVFVTALRRLPGLRDHAALGGWLAAIARSRAADHHRAALPSQPLAEEMPAPPRASAEALAAIAAIRALPEAYRETLVLRLVEGMTGPEIAERTGLTAGSVRVNLHRGMALLRERLERGKR